MKRASIFLALAAVAWVVTLWWYSDKQVLKRQSGDLLELLVIAKDGDQNARQMGAFTLNRLLGAQIVLSAEDVPEANGEFPKAELESAYAVYHSRVKRGEFTRVSAYEIMLSGDAADVSFDVETLVETGDLRVMEGERRVKLRWEKDAKENWLLVSAECLRGP